MNVSIAGFRHQTRSDFSAVVRTQSGARSFANDAVLKTRQPHRAKVAQQTIRASSGNNGSNKPPLTALMRRS